MEKENQVRERVRELRSYYTNLVVYAGVSGSCILVWLLNGAGAFWPIWPIAAFGTAAALQGVRLGQLKILADYLPFLSPEWEDRQIETLMKPTVRSNIDPKIVGNNFPEKQVAKVRKVKEKVKEKAKKTMLKKKAEKKPKKEVEKPPVI